MLTEDQKRAQKRVVKSHPKASKKILNQVRKAMETTENKVNDKANLPSSQTTVNDQNSEATPLTAVPAGKDSKPEIKYELMPGLEVVNSAELNELLDQNVTMKTEIGQLVGLFKNFEGLISGKGGMGSLMLTIPKLLNNPQVNAQIAAIQPILEKYTTTP